MTGATADHADRAALRLAAAGTGSALVLAALVERPALPWLIAAGVAGLALGVGMLSGRSRWDGWLMRAGALLSTGLAGMTLGDAAAFWPGALVAAFASRVLAEDNDLRLARAWSGAAGVAAQAQSTGSAIAVAVALGLVGAWALPLLPASAGGPVGSVLLAALRGSSLLHGAVLFTFAVCLGFLLDAWLLHARDRAAWAGATAALSWPDAGASGPTAARSLGSVFAALPASSQARLAPMLADLGALPGEYGARAAAARAIAEGTRRFMRAVLALLPLVGFVGTVVGLSIAIGALPADLAGAGGRVDIAGAVGGLAVKFETTLLGLGGAFIAALLLSWLERAEAGFVAMAALSCPAQPANGLGRTR
jgi:hypothetical protein